jgi:ubiquinone/menaquinone biosynthesis C-methylase UbiE
MASQKISHEYLGLGNSYDKARPGNDEFAEFLVSNLVSSKELAQHPLTFVELGCGGGQQTTKVANNLISRGITDFKLLAYDYSFTPAEKLEAGAPMGQLNVLAKKQAEGVIPSQVIWNQLDIDGKRIPLESASVDVCFMAMVLHHLTHKRETISELSRITRTDGRIFIFGASREDLADDALNQFFPEKVALDEKRYPSLSEITELLETSGFTSESPYRILRDSQRRVDREFLSSVLDRSLNSALELLYETDRKAYDEGVARVQAAVKAAEESDAAYITYDRYRTVYWGRRMR